MDATAILPELLELAGPQAVREIVLDRELEREFEARGLLLDPDAVEAERARLVSALGVQPDQPDALTGQVLESRGLGPTRLPALLRRNAMLRRLAQPRVTIDDQSVEMAYRIRYGTQHHVRVIVTSTADEASRALAAVEIRSGELGLGPAFARAALESSIDPSAEVGGSLGPISLSDPGLPAVLRQAVRDAPIGSLGPIVALNRGYAVLLVERVEQPDAPPFETVRDDLRDQVRARQERLQMATLAEDLIARARVSPLHPSLRWSWSAATRNSRDQSR